MFEKTQEFLDGFLKMGVPGYDIVIFKDGRQVYRRIAGYSDLENKTETSGKEKYNLYSCSKIITVTAALMLYEKGLFSLEDKLSDYMPEFKEMRVKTASGREKRAENDILLRHLFTMQAGFNYNTSAAPILKLQRQSHGVCKTRDVAAAISEEPLEYEPGTNWGYSLAHDVLAAFIEVVSGEKFEDYVKNNIFIPLEMENTTFMLPESEIETVAPQYRFNTDTGKAENCGKQIQYYKLGSSHASGGAGGISTVEDYIKFLEALRTFRLLKKETVGRMTECELSGKAYESFWCKGYNYGLGVRVTDGKSSRCDFGWGGAAGAYAAVDLTRGLSVYYAQHLLNPPNADLKRDMIDYINQEIKYI